MPFFLVTKKESYIVYWWVG